ncbi:MAG: hypothetical protein HRU19_01225 [Pseudobacteriovorax sp.]|nr:hypothetical protein [Pseudobacteriovorax sp.]
MKRANIAMTAFALSSCLFLSWYLWSDSKTEILPESISKTEVKPKIEEINTPETYVAQPNSDQAKAEILQKKQEFHQKKGAVIDRIQAVRSAHGNQLLDISERRQALISKLSESERLNLSGDNRLAIELINEEEALLIEEYRKTLSVLLAEFNHIKENNQ